MAPLTTVSRDELLGQRARILERLGITLQEYMRRARESELSGPEWEVRDDLDSISFLLGEDDFVD